MHHFKPIIGHQKIIASLSQSIKNHTTGHAYIFEGEKGVGKMTLAKAFAKALNCQAAAEADEPCRCLSCRVFDSGNHPDVFYVKGTNKNSMGAEDVRTQIIKPMSVKPFRYRYKIFILDEAQSMTPGAQNVLLKTIEEPASYGVFVFLVDSVFNLLPTVLSRCILYKLKPLPDELVKHALTGLPEDKAAYYAKFAYGSIGRAFELADSEDFNAMRVLSAELVTNAHTMDTLQAMAFYRKIEKWKDKITALLDILYIDFSEADVFKTDAIIQAKKNLKQNGNFQMVMEVMLLKIAGKIDTRQDSERMQII